MQYILAIILNFAKTYCFSVAVLSFSIVFDKTAARDRIILQLYRRDPDESHYIIAMLWYPIIEVVIQSPIIQKKKGRLTRAIGQTCPM